MSKKIFRFTLALTMAASMAFSMLSAFADDEVKIPGGTGNKQYGGIYAGDQTIAHYIQSGSSTANVGNSSCTLSAQREVAVAGGAWKIAPTANNWNIWAQNGVDEASGGNWVSMGGSMEPYMDLSAYKFEDLAFGCWMRADAATWNSNWSVDLRFTIFKDGDSSKRQTLYWNKWASAMGLENGKWAYVTFKFSEALDESNWSSWNDKADTVDLAHVREFSFSAPNGNTYYPDALYLDEMNFIVTGKTANKTDTTGLTHASLPTGDNVRVNKIFDCDSAGNMEGFTVNTENKTEGTGSLSVALKGGELRSLILDPALTQLAQLKNADEAYLTFDLYVENADDIVQAMQVQTYYNLIAGANDDNNVTWWIGYLHNGWNRLVLPFSNTANVKLGYSDAVLAGLGPLYLKGDTMFSAANTLRMIITPKNDTTILLDNISVVSVGADDIVKLEPDLTTVNFDISNIKTEYEIGEELDLSKLVVTAEFEDGTSADVTKDITVNAEAFDSTKEGFYEIELSYKDGAYTKTFEVSVSEKASDEGGIRFTTDEGVTFVADKGVFPAGTTFTSKEVTSGASHAAVEKVENIRQFVAYDITAASNNAAVQPNGTVKVTFDIPKDFDPAKTVLYSVSNAGKLELIASSVDAQARKITADLTHFSTYVVAEVKDMSAANPNQGNTENNGKTPGTGVPTAAGGFAALALSACATFLFFRKRTAK